MEKIPTHRIIVMSIGGAVLMLYDGIRNSLKRRRKPEEMDRRERGAYLLGSGLRTRTEWPHGKVKLPR